VLSAADFSRVTLDDWLNYRYWIVKDGWYEYISTMEQVDRAVRQDGVRIVRAAVAKVNAEKVPYNF
jgi:hypothetical protein